MPPIEVFSFPKSEFHDDPHLRYRSFSSQYRPHSSLSAQSSVHFGPRADSAPLHEPKHITSDSSQASLPLRYVSLPRNYLQFDMQRTRIMPSTSASSARKSSRSRAPNDEPPAPSYHGYLHDELDLIYFMEAVFTGHCPHVKRRLHNHECEQIIRSGQVWICNTEASGVQRWTDGFDWSPSRALGAFLVYRQVKKAPGQEKKLLKRKLSDMESTKHCGNTSPTDKSGPGPVVKNEKGDEVRLNDYIGALLDQYDYVEDGLVKKTITLTVAGQSHHVICYYSIDDAINGRLQRPSRDPRFTNLQPRQLLWQNEKIAQQLNQYSFKFPQQNNPNLYRHPQHMLYNPQVSFGMAKPPTPAMATMVDSPQSQAWMAQSRPAGLTVQQQHDYIRRASVDASRVSASQQPYSPIMTPSSATYIQQQRNQQLAMRAHTPTMPPQQHQQNSFHSQRAFSVPNLQHHLQQQHANQPAPYTPASTALSATSSYYAADSYISAQPAVQPQFANVSYTPPVQSYNSPARSASVAHSASSPASVTQAPVKAEPTLDRNQFVPIHSHQPSTGSSADYSTAAHSDALYSRAPLEDGSIDPQIRQPEGTYARADETIAQQPQHHVPAYGSMSEDAGNANVQQGHPVYSHNPQQIATSLPQGHSSTVGYAPLNESLENWQFPNCNFDTQQNYSYSGLYPEHSI